MYGFVYLPDRMSDEEVQKALRGAAGILSRSSSPRMTVTTLPRVRKSDRTLKDLLKSYGARLTFTRR